MNGLKSIGRSLRGAELGRNLYRGLVATLLFMAFAPTPVLAQSGTTAIFGDASIMVMSIGGVDVTSVDNPDGKNLSGGLPLTCRSASASAAQLNSGRIDPPGAPSLPGLQMANFWSVVNFLDDYASGSSLLPIDLYFEGAAAPLAPAQWTTDPDPTTTNPPRIWADAPAGSRWVYPYFDGTPPELGTDTLASVYFGGWYVPTAQDASKMRVRLTYRADDQLVAVYLNDMLQRNNLLKAPITRDTSSVGTEPGVVELSGFVQGVNLLSLVVHSTQGPNQAANYQGIAAAFDAYCETPPPTAVPALTNWGLMLLGLLATGLGARQWRRRA